MARSGPCWRQRFAAMEDVAVYKVEPFVVAADVYTAPGHLGRGGWTWYTGSASWMYRVGLEAILGFQKHGNELEIRPRVPASWTEYSITYRYGQSTYEIVVHDPGAMQGGDVKLVVDGLLADGSRLRLVDDGKRHRVEARGARGA
jgi:cyclic beta-1,2-glucan synthetase